ncbi:hypothetical protein ACA910_015697 [Epithemia clementina (nom. ined.)]
MLSPWRPSEGEERMLTGKISMAFYILALLLLSLLGLSSLLAPRSVWNITNGDTGCCFHNSNDNALAVWFFTFMQMMALFVTLFVIALTLLGHSTSSCLLFWSAPTLIYVILATLPHSNGNALNYDDDIDDNILDITCCLQNWKTANLGFLFLTGTAALLAWMDDYQTSANLLGGRANRAGDNATVANTTDASAAPTEQTPLMEDATTD